MGRTDRVRFPKKTKGFTLFHSILTRYGAYPFGTRGTLPGVKQPGSESNNTSSSVEIKNIEANLLPPYIIMTLCLIN
jgi:hypothetical protein